MLLSLLNIVGRAVVAACGMVGVVIRMAAPIGEIEVDRLCDCLLHPRKASNEALW